MMDYIVKMGMKSLVEKKFTKNLVLEFWDDKNFISGTRQDISYLQYASFANKRFEWTINFVPKMDENFAF